MTNANEMLAVLADPTRQAILERLSDGPLAVGQLADLLPVSRPAVSQHLKVLKAAGLVFDREQGTRRIYQVDPNVLAQVRDHLDQMWARSLAAFEKQTRQRKEREDDQDR